MNSVFYTIYDEGNRFHLGSGAGGILGATWYPDKESAERALAAHGGEAKGLVIHRHSISSERLF